MGYVHDTAMSQVIDPAEFQHSAGTWTQTNAANMWYLRRTAADVNFVSKIPIKIPQNSVALKGSKLVSVQLFYDVTVGALTTLGAALYKATLPADGAAMATALVATSYDTGHDAAGERVDVDQHKMTLTLTTPAWLDDDDLYYVEVTVDPAANSVFDWYAARANFTLRV
jgi:hypothetical protein